MEIRGGLDTGERCDALEEAEFGITPWSELGGDQLDRAERPRAPTEAGTPFWCP